MKKTKIISILIAMLAVVALGVFMGKYIFKLMEATGGQAVTTEPPASGADGGLTVKVLYGDSSNADASREDKVPSFETLGSSSPKIEARQVHSTDGSSVALKSDKADSGAASPTVTLAPKNSLAFSPTGVRWYAFATTNGLNVRETPNVKGKFMFKVAKGTRGVVKEKKNGWTYIQWDFNRKKGWSIDEYLVQGPAIIFESAVANPEGNKESGSKEQTSQASIQKAIETNKTIVGMARSATASETVISYTDGRKLPKRGTITPQGGANVREKPTTKSNRLIKLPKGTVVGIKSVQLVGKQQWFEITYSNGSKTGWTIEDNLKF